jgi:hypothetical protein
LRYGLSLAVAVSIIGAGMMFVRQTRRSIEKRARQTLREAKASGKLPAGIDPERANLSDFGFPLSHTEIRRLKIAHLLVDWRLILIPFILLGSLGVAYLLKRPS